MLGIFDYETIKEEERQRPVSSPGTSPKKTSTSPTAPKVKTSFTSLQQHSNDSLLPKTDTTSTTATTSSHFLPSSCSNNGAQQRKRKPLKSISNKDETPGLTFKLSGTSTSSLNFEFSPSTFTHSMHSLFLEDGFNSSYSSTTTSTTTRRRRLSSSCFNIIQTSNHCSGSQTPKNTAAATPTHTPSSSSSSSNYTPKPRQRAQSLSFSVNTTTTTTSSKRASQGNRRSSVSITSILQSCRSSDNGSSESFSPPNSTPPSSQEIGNGNGNGHGSLTHLIPNSFLQTTSRRTSTHTSVTECFCSSCSSTITPYWRDGWSSNVMLCNACGLRYQKFATRCPECRYIPRKEDGLGGNCIKCHTPWHVGPEDSSIRGTGYNPSGLLI